MSASHMIDVDGFQLHAMEDGTGRPVVFGHGLLFDWRSWAGQTPLIAVDHRVVAFDSRGHGLSGLPEDDWSIQDQADDYARVMDALGIDRAVVVGESMGGMAALHLALRHPQRVKGLVLVDASASAETLYQRTRYRLMVLMARLFGMRPWLLAEASKSMFGATFRRTQPEQVKQWMEPMAEYDPKVIARTLRPVMTRPSVVGRLPTITAPVLVIVGDEDQTTPPRESEVLAERMPNARLVTLGATGHMAPIEKPEQTGVLIREFLREIGW